MDKTTAIVICFGVLVLAFVSFFLIFRSKGKGGIKGPFGIGMNVEGSNEPVSQPSVIVKDAEAGGSIRVKDDTGKGAAAEKLKAVGDIEISSSHGTPPKR
jgi:hypothetical protein